MSKETKTIKVCKYCDKEINETDVGAFCDCVPYGYELFDDMYTLKEVEEE